ncbi:LysM domain-containing protein [Paenibacillus glucanolyticus]|uniref:LysM peptidoglycan-binding domain-containing protein n=1 Tax=Paenibacillus glucanolyticus TaxID=59843 RepID=UPI0035D60BBD
MAKLDGHTIHVITEMPAYSVEVTKRPVETGMSITDHVEPQPTILTLEGKILGPNSSSIRSKLKKAMDSGKLVSYKGRNTFADVVIESFDSTHDARTSNGFVFTATLVEIRIAKPSYGALESKQQTQVKSTTNGGQKQTQNKKQGATYHTIRKGQSFSSIAPKYGTTWQKIKQLNVGVDPNKLQIGQKVRVS